MLARILLAAALTVPAGAAWADSATVTNDTGLVARTECSTGTSPNAVWVPCPPLGNSVVAPSSAASAGISPITSSALESSHVFKSSGGNLYGVYVNSTAAGYLMTFDAAVVPSNGAVTPVDCVPVAAGSMAYINYGPGPAETFKTGIVAAYSTTGCLTLTLSATAWFHGSVQ